MSVPGIVQSTLDGEEIAARVSIGGEDELFVTPQNTIIYRAEGLLSDESIDEFPHDADRLTLSEGRRKTRFSLEYALDGTRDFTIPSSRTEDVLLPVLAGVLTGNGITDSGESVVQTYRFSELTLIVTTDRLVKHIGEAVWDGDFEQYHFDDVTNLSFEDGSVATQIVIEVDGRPHRIKAPNDQADDVCERLKRALFSYHDVSTLAELNDALGEDEDETGPSDPTAAFGSGVDPLETDSSNSDADAGEDSVEAETGPSDRNQDRDRDGDRGETQNGDPLEVGATVDSSPSSGAETAERTARSQSTDSGGRGEADELESSARQSGSDPELLERLDALEATVDEQNALLSKHQETIEQLITELRQGR